jgi:hypothetical protein
MEPDFERLPPGPERVFTGRIDRLPVGALRRHAIVHSKLEFQRAFCERHRVHQRDGMAFGTWHLRAALDRLSAARHDLIWYRPGLPRSARP